MRITLKGKKNLQDFDTKDHAAAGHALVVPPLPLAMRNVGIAFRCMETAKEQLDKAQRAGLAATARELCEELQAFHDVLKELVGA